MNWNIIMELKEIFYKTSHLAEGYSENGLDGRNVSFVKRYELKKLNSEPKKSRKISIKICFLCVQVIHQWLEIRSTKTFVSATFNLPH